MIYHLPDTYKINLNKILILVCWFLFCFISVSFSQIIDFKHYSIKDGLSQIEIKCLFQDTEGYLWIGTQNGLNKFDGYYFENIFNDPTDSTTISSNWIFGITEDSEGNLWIGTKEGLNKYDKRNDVFYRINYKNENSVVIDNFVYGVASDSSNIYTNTPPSLSVLNYKTGNLKVYNNDFAYDGILYDLTYPIIVGRDGLVWIGSQRGLYYFNLQDERFFNFKVEMNNHNAISNYHITALIFLIL